MTPKEKAIKVIKQIRQMENDVYNKKIFCKEHNFMLEANSLDSVESSLRKVCRLLENEFETGYISIITD